MLLRPWKRSNLPQCVALSRLRRITVYTPASFQLKPYVHVGVRLSRAEERAVFGNFPGPRGLTPEHFLKVAREYTQAANRLPKPEEKQQETSVDLTVTNTSVTEGGAEKPSTQGELARS
jgi:large subunit ribosomal protein L41